MRNREAAIDAFMKTNQTIEAAIQADPDAGKKAFSRMRAAAVNKTLGRHLMALDNAIEANTSTAKGAAAAHLAGLRAEAPIAASRMDPIVPQERPRSSPGASF